MLTQIRLMSIKLKDIENIEMCYIITKEPFDCCYFFYISNEFNKC